MLVRKRADYLPATTPFGILVRLGRKWAVSAWAAPAFLPVPGDPPGRSLLVY